MLPELTLLERARSLDREALANIYNTYSPGIYRYALRMLGDTHQAEDCVAETFSRFLHVMHQRKGPRDYLQAYLYRIAHNWISDLYRNQKPQDELDDQHPDPAPLPEENAGNRIRSSRLRNAMQYLTTEQQQVIALKFIEGWENEEIARSLNKPVGAVKSMQHRALVKLKHMLGNEEYL